MRAGWSWLLAFMCAIALPWRASARPVTATEIEEDTESDGCTETGRAIAARRGARLPGPRLVFAALVRDRGERPRAAVAVPQPGWLTPRRVLAPPESANHG